MNARDLHETARSLVAPGKGVLAADESTGTIAKRLQSVGVSSTEETRRSYRELLFTTPGLGDHISGVILFDETIRQQTRQGSPFPEVLLDQGILPGIKVDEGKEPLPNFPEDTVTKGLDGLRRRLPEYRELGARFTKWRAVYTVGNTTPSRTCVEANAHALARFAALSQEAGLVPIVEPEVLMDGGHTIEQCFEVTERTLQSVFPALFEYRVQLEGMLLKPNMVVSGLECPEQADLRAVAEATLQCLKRTVPAAVPGVVFLSGGQDEFRATQHLDAMNRRGGVPWELSFSYGRALQGPALHAWGGKPENVSAAQAALHHRARCNGAARFGRYSEAMEQERATTEQPAVAI